MIIALASPRIALSIEDGLDKIKRLLSEASAQGAQIVCFPEAYLPDRTWAEEARNGWDAYKAGRLRTVSYEEVMSRYRDQ